MAQRPPISSEALEYGRCGAIRERRSDSLYGRYLRIHVLPTSRARDIGDDELELSDLWGCDYLCDDVLFDSREARLRGTCCAYKERLMIMWRTRRYHHRFEQRLTIREVES